MTYFRGKGGMVESRPLRKRKKARLNAGHREKKEKKSWLNENESRLLRNPVTAKCCVFISTLQH
jgi:hypothetical protein